MSASLARAHCLFQSTLPAWGSDRARAVTNPAIAGFQSTLPAWGSDAQNFVMFSLLFSFQSTLPAWGSDYFVRIGHGSGVGFNPRSPRGGATTLRASFLSKASVSIHAPRVGERRRQRLVDQLKRAGFNPRSPRGGATNALTTEG